MYSECDVGLFASHREVLKRHKSLIWAALLSQIVLNW
jgi:hypothetical protein